MFTSPKTATLILLSVCAFWSTSSRSASAEDEPFWPRFHGPNGDNISTETGLLKQWPEAGPKLLWTARGLGFGFSGVSIARGMMYTSGNIEGKTVVTALDMDGRIVWQVANGDAWTRSHPGSRTTPTVDGDRLYHKSPLGDATCFDARTGKRIWTLNILQRFQAKNTRWALPESLLIDGDRVICSPGGPKAAMVALDKHTGRVVWTTPSTGELAGYASPNLIEQDGLRMLLTFTSGSFIGVNADSGKLLWRFKRTVPWEETIMMPLYHDRQVLISTGHRTGTVKFAVHVQGDRARLEELWRSEELDVQHGGVILLDGRVHGACHSSNNQKWVCLDWKTGRKLYADRVVGRGSLTSAEGLLYMLSERSRMGLVRAGPDGYEVVGRFRLPLGGEGPSWAHPVVRGHRLYIRHADYLYAYDIRANP